MKIYYTMNTTAFSLAVTLALFVIISFETSAKTQPQNTLAKQIELAAEGKVESQYNSSAKLRQSHNIDSKIFSKYYPSNIFLQREQYRQAQHALKTKDYKKYQAHRKTLDQYALAAQLDYQYLTQNIADTTQDDIKTFKQNYAEQGRNAKQWSANLLKTRLRYLAKQHRWADYLNLYGLSNHQNSPTVYRCHYAQALYLTEQTAKALTLAKELWLTPQSMPAACDAIFKVFTNKNIFPLGHHITSEIAWQRFTAAFANNQVTLAKYLTRYLNEATQATAESLIGLYVNPQTITDQWQNNEKLIEQHISPKQADSIRLLLLKRFIRKYEQEAIVFLQQNYLVTPSKPTLAKSSIGKLQQYALQKHALKDYNDLENIYKQLGSPLDVKSIEWMIRSSIATAKWDNASQYIQLLPSNKQYEDRWQYWKLRTQQLQSPLKQPQQLAFKQLAEKANFYGFFAAKHLDIDFKISPIQNHLSEKNIDQLLGNSGIKLALEYFIQGQHRLAHNEWVYALRNADSEQRVDAAYLAFRFGWYNQAISSAATAKAWQHYGIRFPEFMAEAFTTQALRFNHPPQWFYATARQESALAQQASSSAGALGLMQVLPKTAAAQAKQLNLNYHKNLLLEPDYSIKIGSAYLAQLYNRYGNRALSSAAYNAGPHRVDQWLGNLHQAVPLDAWIETIRFSETRQYVQNILSFSLIHSTLHQLPQGNINPWPSFVFAEDREMMINPLQQQIVQNSTY